MLQQYILFPTSNVNDYFLPTYPTLKNPSHQKWHNNFTHITFPIPYQINLQHNLRIFLLFSHLVFAFIEFLSSLLWMCSPKNLCSIVRQKKQNMSGKSDFAQKLLYDLKLRKERVAAAQNTGYSYSTPRGKLMKC